MSSTNNTLAQSLLSFGQSYSQYHLDYLGHLPIIEYDEQWKSPCETGFHDEAHTYWQPSKIIAEEVNFDEHIFSFANVETALALELHPDIKTYYSTMFSSEVEAVCDEGQLSLLFAWNTDDFERLQENIIGHLLMKQKLKQPETIFFAVTDEEDMIISINNDSGEVWVEQVGCKPHKKLSDSIESFLLQLKPYIPQ